ncbi:MAG: homocysteine S-methyltransferase family protein [Collinsella sp.]|nr:homocysteine S-methyltransferase family protein [Collinsella sp.]
MAPDDYDWVGAGLLRSGLSSGTLLAQGPMGSVLASEVDSGDIPAAFWNMAEPQVVSRVHTLYGLVGAEVMITNTFQASAPALVRDGISQGVDTVNRAAVDCARSAHARMVLGSIGPVGLDWIIQDSREFREARSAYRDQALALLRSGVSGILLETFTSLRDLEPALAGVFDVSQGMPVLVSFAIDGKCSLLGDGLNIEAAVSYAGKAGADAVGVNCCGIDVCPEALSRMKGISDLPLMVRPHAGLPSLDEEGVPRWTEKPERFARASVTWRELGAALVGSCCGATAQSTCAMAMALGKFDRP